MKKSISLLLSVIMLLSAFMASSTAYAAGWISQVKNINLNTQYTEYVNSSDTHNEEGYYDTFKIVVPVSGKVQLRVESENEFYISAKYTNEFTKYFIYSENDIDSYLIKWNWTNDDDYGYIQSHGVYYEDYHCTLPKGIYYYVVNYSSPYWANGDTYVFTLKYTPSISKPSTFKVSSRKKTSIGLTWSKVGDIDGYQLQRNTSNGWKQVTNTTSNSYTVSNLKAGTKYDFRVRTYIEADGKKYYSGWKKLATPTKPNKPGIKTPVTNKKHQIIAKWNKVSACTGYQVQYSKKKSFSSVIASRIVSGKDKTSYTGKNFTKGKTYYIRVRAYKTVNGTKYYGAWSKVKSIKCK